MRKVFIVLAILAVSGLSLKVNGQSSPSASSQTQAGLPAPHHFRPKLPMQEGLKIAEKYIADQHIDIAPYYLFQVRYILLGDEHTAESKKIPVWHFWWDSETGKLGNYVEIIVDMDGHASRAPSM